MRSLSLVLMLSMATGCAQLVADAVEGAVTSALEKAATPDDSDCEVVPGKQPKRRNCGPPPPCVTNGKGCFHINDPEWKDAMNLADPPTGSVRPPPTCSVCSPNSAPAPRSARTPAIQTSSKLPKYLMSNSCLVDHMKTHDFVQWAYALQRGP